MRNLSATGAFIEGLIEVPVGTRFVIDFGEGQLVTATVRRSMKHQQGIEFETPLVSDGNGGLCTRHRVSPYLIAAAAQHGSAVALPTFTTMSDWKAPSGLPPRRRAPRSPRSAERRVGKEWVWTRAS